MPRYILCDSCAPDEVSWQALEDANAAQESVESPFARQTLMDTADEDKGCAPTEIDEPHEELPPYPKGAVGGTSFC